MLVKCLVQWLSADPSCHLHSTDTPEFCEEEEDDDTGGSASVSMTAAVSELEDGEEEEDEEDTATVPGEETGFKMCRVLRQVETSFSRNLTVRQSALSICCLFFTVSCTCHGRDNRDEQASTSRLTWRTSDGIINVG